MSDPKGRLRSREFSFWLTAAAAAGIVFIGARFIIAPAAGADGYGVPAPVGVSAAYLWAKGIRDVVSGLIGAAFLVAGWRRPLGLFLAIAMLIPIFDAFTVSQFVGPSPLHLAIHGGTAIYMGVLSYVLLRR